MRQRWHGVRTIAIGAVILGGGALAASAQDLQAKSDSSPATVAGFVRSGFADLTAAVGLDDDGEATVPAGTLDDGKELLPQATITLERAVAAAQGAESGAIGEVDLERYRGRLVFNVDVGDKDVKVDAATGEILGAVADD